MATAVWTNNGLILAAQAGVQNSCTYIGIGTGCGTLASALSSGTAYTSLTLNAALPAALSGSQSVVITDGTNSQTVTVVSGGAAQGATAISVTSFTASYSFAANTTGVVPLPQASDSTLYNETERVPITTTASGATPGESLLSAYFDGTQATAIYLSVGYFGGSGATASTGTGTLMIEDVQYWNHTLDSDTQMYQADATI